jgi:hypothetical protein
MPSIPSVRFFVAKGISGSGKLFLKIKIKQGSVEKSPRSAQIELTQRDKVIDLRHQIGVDGGASERQDPACQSVIPIIMWDRNHLRP